MRTVKEIKKGLTDVYISNVSIRNIYSLDTSKTFEEQFSTASLESVLFYAIAFSMHIIERLLGTHKNEVKALLKKLRPHTKDWYREKILRFQYPGRALETDSDYYNNSGLSLSDIASLEVVKFCALEEINAWLKIKVAKGVAGSRLSLSSAEVVALAAYIDEIKDAGVNIEIVNMQADMIFAEIDIYYNPLLLTPSLKTVEAVFKEYISTLEFNGIMKTNRLVDAMQKVAGVELVNPLYIKIQRAANPVEPIGVQKIAMSGYWVLNQDSDLIINYKPYKYENI